MHDSVKGVNDHCFFAQFQKSVDHWFIFQEIRPGLGKPQKVTFRQKRNFRSLIQRELAVQPCNEVYVVIIKHVAFNQRETRDDLIQVHLI